MRFQSLVLSTVQDISIHDKLYAISFFILLNGTASVYVDSRRSNELRLLPPSAIRASSPQRKTPFRTEQEPFSYSPTSAEKRSEDCLKASTESVTKFTSATEGPKAQHSSAEIVREEGFPTAAGVSLLETLPVSRRSSLIMSVSTPFGRKMSTASHTSHRGSGTGDELSARDERRSNVKTHRANSGRDQKGSPQRLSSDMAAIDARVRSIGATRCAPEERHRLGKLVTQYGMQCVLHSSWSLSTFASFHTPCVL